MDRLKGKRTIVTGAASGIGKAIAERFAQEGARVLVLDVNPEAAQKTARELGDNAIAMPVDVTNAAQVEAAVNNVNEQWGGIDVMVNNAGVGVAAKTAETSEDDWQRVIDVCMKGTFLGMKYVIPIMQKQKSGSIINMSSVAALVGVGDRAAYCAAKGGVMALTRAAAVDHAGEGIRVNCIAPGTVDTPWVQRITQGYDDPEAARAAMKARQPHGRLVAPEEVAAMAVYLASDEAGSTNGAVMVVDGGWTAR
ncbi:MAG TPA: SDR family oxidoreductase [Balneolales bacterium]|nr:SDR family oxidoreductase [Balneolales bacterium]